MVPMMFLVSSAKALTSHDSSSSASSRWFSLLLGFHIQVAEVVVVVVEEELGFGWGCCDDVDGDGDNFWI